jgi:hypothetical protein
MEWPKHRENDSTTLGNLNVNKKVTISVSKNGFEDWSRPVTVEKDKTSTLYASLKQIPKVEEPTKPEPEPASPQKPEPTPSTDTSGRPGSLSIKSDTVWC